MYNLKKVALVAVAALFLSGCEKPGIETATKILGSEVNELCFNEHKYLFVGLDRRTWLSPAYSKEGDLESCSMDDYPEIDKFKEVCVNDTSYLLVAFVGNSGMAPVFGEDKKTKKCKLKKE